VEKEVTDNNKKMELIHSLAFSFLIGDCVIEVLITFSLQKGSFDSVFNKDNYKYFFKSSY